MAGDNGAMDVEVIDDAEVDLDLSDPGVAAALADEGGTVATLKPTAQPRTRTRTSSAADEAAAALTQGLEQERTARAAAEATAEAERRRAEEHARIAAERTREVETLRETTQSQELSLISTGIETAGREIESAQADLERAHEAGDFKAVAAASSKLSKATARMDRLEADKTAFEKRATAPVPERVELQPQQQSEFDRYVSQYPPKAQTWLRAHPEYVPPQIPGGNAKKNSLMMAGHYEAIAAGHEPNSEEYFRTIEERIGERSPTSAAGDTTAAGDPAPRPRPAAPRRTAMPSAPVSRDGTEGGGALTPRTMRLTPAQQEIAMLSFPSRPGETDEAWKKRAFGIYANEFVKAKSEGKIGRLTH